MAIQASDQPNVRPVILAEIEVAVRMEGAILAAGTITKNNLVVEGGADDLVVEGGADNLKTEGA